MLPKKHRLNKDRDIKRVIKFGEPFKKGRLLLKKADNNKSFTRHAVVISSKTEKKAHERNRMRRVILNAIAKHLESRKGGGDWVVWVKKSFNKKEEPEIVNQIGELFR